MSGLDYLEAERSDWQQTGELAAALRTRGRTLPLSDILVAVLAGRYGCRVLTTDNHFRFIPDVKLFSEA